MARQAGRAFSGRADWARRSTGECLPGETAKQQSLDLTPILWVDEQASDQPQFCQVASNDPFDTADKANQMVAEILPAIEAASGGSFAYTGDQL